MLNAIIRFSLQHRSLIVIGSLVVLVYGAYLTTTMPIDVFPDLDRPRVTILTECHGLAAEEVETLVTFPIESVVIGGSGVIDVRTQSAGGLSSVVVEFDWGMDMRAARQIVQERLATITSDLPADVRPQMAPPGAMMGQIMLAGLRQLRGPNGGDLVPISNTSYVAERVRKQDGSLEIHAWNPLDRRNHASWSLISVVNPAWDTPDSDGNQRVRALINGQAETLTFPSDLRRQLDLRSLADWVVRPRLLKISGVAQVLTVGGGRKQYQILVDPLALHEFGLTLQDVEDSLKANNLNTSGGFSTEGGVEKSIRVIGRLGPEPARVLADLRQIPVQTSGQRAILLCQVARIVEVAQVKRGDASINGEPGVLVTIVKQPHADTRKVTAAVQAALQEIEPSLPADVLFDLNLYQMREFIDRGIFNVGEAMVLGAVLVMIVLFLFLMNFRTTFISLTAIPLSLAVTTIVFRLIGNVTGTELSINVMTLGGIAVAMGELVDDAVVDVENIFRRLRENRQSPSPRHPLSVVYEASVEIRSSIVFGTVGRDTRVPPALRARRH
jgi:Cu/Ag efflux pump CusA